MLGRRRDEASQDDGSDEGRDPATAATTSLKGVRLQIRTFEGDDYKEWRREVEAGAFLRQVPDSQLAGLVYLALGLGEKGPRGLVSHLDTKTEICVEGGLERIWKILDQEYVREAYVNPTKLKPGTNDAVVPQA